MTQPPNSPRLAINGEKLVYGVRLGNRRVELIDQGGGVFAVNIQKNVAPKREKWANKVPTFHAEQAAAFRIARQWCETASLEGIPLP